jgi:hypothetical protein
MYALKRLSPTFTYWLSRTLARRLEQQAAAQR